MAYGYCPNCGCGVRYRVSPQQRSPWLQQLASEIGRGEPAVVLCYGCWKPLQVGDAVEVLDPPLAGPVIRYRARGVVTAIEPAEGGAAYQVEGRSAEPWQFRFHRSRIKALTEGSTGTVSLQLRSG